MQAEIFPQMQTGRPGNYFVVMKKSFHPQIKNNVTEFLV